VIFGHTPLQSEIKYRRDGGFWSEKISGPHRTIPRLCGFFVFSIPAGYNGTGGFVHGDWLRSTTTRVPAAAGGINDSFGNLHVGLLAGVGEGFWSFA